MSDVEVSREGWKFIKFNVLFKLIYNKETWEPEQRTKEEITRFTE